MVVVCCSIISACSSGLKLPYQPVALLPPGSSYLAEGAFCSAAVGDFNGDGVLDIACGTRRPGGVRVWMGGDGEKWEERSAPSLKGACLSLVSADFNGDGFDDLAMSCQGDVVGVYVCLSQGEAGWSQPLLVDGAGGYEGITTNDFNNDHRPDLAAANGSLGEAGGVKVWLNLGNNRWFPSKGPRSSGVYRGIVGADFNRDGKMDLAASQWGLDGGVKVWYGNGGGEWSSPYSIPGKGSFWGLATGDVDHNGRPDLVAASHREGVCLFLNTNNNLWQKSYPLIRQGSFWGVAIADFNRDSRMDIAASSIDYQGIKLWLNQGDGRWLLSSDVLPPASLYYTVGFADFNGDQLLDLYSIRGSEGPAICLQREEGELTFVSFTDYTQNGGGGDGPAPPSPYSAVTENKVFTTAMGFPEYRIGPQDKLTINIWTGAEVKEYEVTVQSDGTIFLPLFYPFSIEAANLSPSQLKHKISETLQEYIRDPKVELVVTEYNCRKASLLGEVHSVARADSGPGLYPLTGKTYLIDFLSEHGGATERADISRVRIIRGGKTFVVNLFKTIFQDDPQENPILDDGDLVVIPSVEESDQQIFVLGELTRPGIVQFKGNTTVLEAISQAGGFTQSAVLDNIFLVRGDLRKPEVIKVNLKKLLRNGDLTQNIHLQNKDIVYIPRRAISTAGDFMDVFRPLLDIIQTIFIIKYLVSK